MELIITDKPILIVIIICVMSALLSLYFVKSKQYKKLHTSVMRGTHDKQYLSDFNITEKLQFYEAKLDLYEQVGSVGMIVFDYEPEGFYIDKNGLLLLGMENETKELTHKEFESLIFEDSIDIYESMFDCENIRQSTTAENSFIIKIKDNSDGNFKRFVFKVKPLYNDDGDILILVCAFSPLA